jgi:ABC-type Fe3+-hydroxamate transport system substrate-binding protein
MLKPWLRGPSFLWGLAAALLLALGCAACSEAQADDEARPARIVSINMCTDELLLRLADRDRIASVTWLSHDGRNANMADLAAEFPADHGLAEEVASYHPDLVLAGVYTTRSTVQLLKAIGIKVVEFACRKLSMACANKSTTSLRRSANAPEARPRSPTSMRASGTWPHGRAIPR